MKRASTRHLGPWVRVYVSILDDPKLARLSDAQYRGWNKLLALAKFHGGTVPPDIHDIAYRLRIPEGKTRDLLQVLVSAKLFDQNGNGYTPHNWTERQFESDVSTERVKRFRNRNETVDETFHETPQSVSETVNETAPDTDTDTETESETESEKENKPLSDLPSDACKSEVQSEEHQNQKSANGHSHKPLRYPADFEQFWRDYPTDRLMSKKAAGAQWSRLSPEDRRTAIASIPAFRAYCREHPDYRTLHVERYLSQRRFDGFTGADSSELPDRIALIEQLNQVGHGTEI